MELGPKDLEAQSVVLARRDTGIKETVAWANVANRVPELLEQIQVRHELHTGSSVSSIEDVIIIVYSTSHKPERGCRYTEI